MKKIIIAIIVIALVGAGIYFGNTTLQKGSLGDLPSPAAPSDFLIEYTFPLDPALPPGWCSLETGQSINFVNNSDKPITVTRVGFSIKGNDFSNFSLGNFSLKSPETKESLNYVYSYSSTLKKPGIIYFDLSAKALKPKNLPLIVIQPKSKAHYWFKTTAQPNSTSATSTVGKFLFSPVLAKYNFETGDLGMPDKTFSVPSKDQKWKDLQVCAEPPLPQIECPSGTEWNSSTKTCNPIPTPPPPPPPPPAPSGPATCQPGTQWDTATQTCISIPAPSPPPPSSNG